MKLAVFVLLLVVLPFQAEASSYVCDTLIVTVMRGRSLEGDGFMNPPDPYVKVTVDGQTKQTRVIHNVVNPKWHTDFKFSNVKSDKLVVEIWEYDDFLHGADDHLKTCEEKLKLGSHVLRCGEESSGALAYGVHCLKGNMKREQLTLLTGNKGNENFLGSCHQGTDLITVWVEGVSLLAERHDVWGTKLQN